MADVVAADIQRIGYTRSHGTGRVGTREKQKCRLSRFSGCARAGKLFSIFGFPSSVRDPLPLRDSAACALGAVGYRLGSH